MDTSQQHKTHRFNGRKFRLGEKIYENFVQGNYLTSGSMHQWVLEYDVKFRDFFVQERAENTLRRYYIHIWHTIFFRGVYLGEYWLDFRSKNSTGKLRSRSNRIILCTFRTTMVGFVSLFSNRPIWVISVDIKFWNTINSSF